ncbi:MAG: HAMP domain-containing histidine kinase [Actinomycetota bacterium]|nr:HAMP domain-containing histidine kinase [Actinomycetota bacterium]
MTRDWSLRQLGRNLPLLWKLLVPFLALILVVGSLGAVFLVRDLAVRGETSLDTELGLVALSARSAIHERELSLLESVDFAANIEGMADAVEARDRPATEQLLRSVLALKEQVGVAAVLDARARAVGQLVRTAAGHIEPSGLSPVTGSPGSLGDAAAFVPFAGRQFLVLAQPVCRSVHPCRQVGWAVVGLDATQLTVARPGTPTERELPSGVAVFDLVGRLVARSGMTPSSAAEQAPASGEILRRRGRVGSTDVATLYAPLDVRGQRLGTLAVSIPSGPALATVRATANRLAGVLLAVIVGMMAIGALLSRLILGQVRPLIETHRALGAGDLTARAPIRGRDELGELAHGVNQMAEQLQASQETLENRVEQRTEEIRRLLRERNEFFAALSHDLRTPLAIIRGQATLQTDPSFRKTAAWVGQSGHIVEAAASQVLRLVEDILRLAEAEQAGLALDLLDLPLTEVVADLQPATEQLATEAGIAATFSIATDLPLVRADPVRLREIMQNLLDNAVKYTPPGGSIALTAAASNGHVEIAVRDTGVGIPGEAGHRVFEPFYRVAGTTTQAGQPSSGIGLAVAKRLVEAHGGKLGYTSTPDAGTTFTFTLPSTRGNVDAE